VAANGLCGVRYHARVPTPRPRHGRTFAALAAGLVLTLAGSGTLHADAVAPVGPPRTLPELDARLGALRQRLDRLAELAHHDAFYRVVQAYRGYTPEAFADPHRRVRAKDVVKVLENPEATLQDRRGARDALASPLARKNDPDLDRGDDRRKPRNLFAIRDVAKLVKDRDADTRELSHQLLLAWFPQMANDPAIGLYQARDGNPRQWDAAYRAWLKGLR
jgi:hypothetical protein